MVLNVCDVSVMRRASFKIQKVLDEVRERQAMKTMRERKMTLQRQKSGCENPFFPVQHEKPGEDAAQIVTNIDTSEETRIEKRSDFADSHESVQSDKEDRISIQVDRARKYSVIMEEKEEKVGRRRNCEEEIMQPIKHLSGEGSLICKRKT